MTTTRMEGLSVRLDPTNVQASAFARLCGARRFCANWCVAQVRANQEAWKGDELAGIATSDRVRPLSAMDLERAWRRMGDRAVVVGVLVRVP